MVIAGCIAALALILALWERWSNRKLKRRIKFMEEQYVRRKEDEELIEETAAMMVIGPQ